MKVFTKQEILENKDFFAKEIITGKIFIYPTDTIYGIGCNALLDKAVKKIREIKKRKEQPFSVIAPNKKWIKDNCDLFNHIQLLDKLPGPYTLILPLKKKAVSNLVNPNSKTLGIRIPNHWISNFVEYIQVPIVTTSVNKSGEPYMTSLDDLDEDIKKNIDFIIYEGEKFGKPSTLVIVEKEKVDIKEREIKKDK